MNKELREIVEAAWVDRSFLKITETKQAIREVIRLLDIGELRVAEPVEEISKKASWKVNEWIKKAVILYFIIQDMQLHEVGIFEFYDKIPLKKNYKKLGVRVVPHAIARCIQHVRFYMY